MASIAGVDPTVVSRIESANGFLGVQVRSIVRIAAALAQLAYEADDKAESRTLRPSGLSSLKHTAKPESVARTTSEGSSTPKDPGKHEMRTPKEIPGRTEGDAGSMSAPEAEMFATVPEPSMSTPRYVTGATSLYRGLPRRSMLMSGSSDLR